MINGTIEALADRGDTSTPRPRCDHESSGVRCCREPHGDGPHLYRCASEACPGYPWRASHSPHPCKP